MGVKQDAEDSLKDYFITKIDGQPTEQDISKLKLELSEGLASIPTTNGGGQHGHIGLIIPSTEYVLFSHGAAPYDLLTNPGPFPTTVDPDAVVRERQIAEHKAEIREYELYLGVSSWARKAIVGAIDEEWLSEIRSPHVGFNHLSPAQLLTHLEDVGGEVDYMDVTELQAELTTAWDQVEAPTTLFERGDKIERQLVKAGIPAQPQLRLATALCWFQQSGEFDNAIREWHLKPTAAKTFTAFRVFIQKEFAKRQKRDKQTAKATGRGIANSAMGQDIPTEAELNAMAMAEFVNAVTTNNNAQMEKMMEMFTKSLETMTNNKQSDKKTTPTNQQCPHCKLRHPNPDKCWELESNAASRPKTWKPVAERKKQKESQA